MKPTRRPRRPEFSSCPCAKRPGWSLQGLKNAPLGRSHRAKVGKDRLKAVIDRSRALLALPGDWRLGIVPASDTGAFEMAMWSLLGARGVEVLVWESFGQGWAEDVTRQLKLDARVLEAAYGALPDLAAVDFERDVVFTWNGTTSGMGAGVSCCVTRPRLFLPCRYPGKSSMWSPGRGRRCWVARALMACWRSH